MATLGSLVVSLAVDTARFQGDLGRAATIAESRMRNIKDVSTKALGAITVAATAAGGALVYALKSAIDRADNMRDLAQSAGVTVEQLSRLAFAGKQSGVEIDQIGKALAKLSAAGVPDANAALLDLADVFASMPDGAAKTALAIDKFGERIGPALIPLLNEGRAGLVGMGEEAKRLGLELSTSAAAGADQFNDSLGVMKGIVEGLGNSLAAQMLPVLNEIADSFTKSATGADRLSRAAEQLATFLKLLVDIGFSVYSTFNNVGTALAALAAATTAALQGDVRRAASILKDANAEQIANEKAANEFLEKLWSDRVATAEAAAKQLTRIQAISRAGGSEIKTRYDPKTDPFLKGSGKEDDKIPALSFAQQMVQEAQDARVREYWEGVEISAKSAAEAQEIAADGLAEVSKEMEAEFASWFEGTEQISVFAEQSARNMQDSFAQFLFDPFDQGLKGMLAGFLDTIRRMVAEAASAQILGSLFNFIGGKAGGGVGAFFSNMAGGILGKRAGGGPVSAGGAYLVGERGPELLQMGSMGGTVIPNHAMGGGITINNHIDARGADAERIMAMLPPLLKQNSDQTVARIRDMNGRGRL
jgi:DNA-binding phage protein